MKPIELPTGQLSETMWLKSEIADAERHLAE